jgi:hypothetical protein
MRAWSAVRPVPEAPSVSPRLRGCIGCLAGVAADGVSGRLGGASRAVIVALGLGATWSHPALAEPPKPDETCPAPPYPTGQAAENRARKIFQRAVTLEAGSPREAFELYQCARKLSDKPVLALRLGTLGESLGETDIALAALASYLELAGADAPDAEEIRKRIETLREKKRAAAPSVEVSGTPIEDPAASSTSAASPPPPVRSPRRTIAGLATLGAGAIVAGVGGFLLYDARSTSNELAQTPPGRVYWDSPEGQGKLDQAKSRQTMGIVGVSLGGALAVTGVVLLLTGSPGPTKQVEVAAGPVRGGFAASTSWSF